MGRGGRRCDGGICEKMHRMYYIILENQFGSFGWKMRIGVNLQSNLLLPTKAVFTERIGWNGRTGMVS